MTKRKKIIIISISVICLCAILLSVFWFVPALRWQIFGIPIETEEFVPEPDSIVATYAEKEFVLSDQQKQAVHKAFIELVPALTACERETREKRVIDERPWDQCTRMEFSYDRVYQYKGTIEPLLSLFGEEEFNKFHVDTWEKRGRIDITVYLEQKHSADEEEICVTFYLGDERAGFEKSIDRVIGECVYDCFGVESHLGGATVVETNCFLERPDSMVLYNNGKGVMLSDEQKNQIYAAFAQMDEEQEGLPLFSHDGLRDIYKRTDMYEEIETTPCLEFRYDQRRKYTGSYAECAEQQAEGEIHYLNSTLEYDAILLILHEPYIRVILCKDGLHSTQSPAHKPLQYGEGYVEFRSKVISLAQ